MKPLVRQEGVNVEWVHELFEPGTRSWNEQLVHDSFTPHDAEEILKARPRIRMQEDMIAWSDERNGWYSVWSCYRRLKADQDQRGGDGRKCSGLVRQYTVVDNSIVIECITKSLDFLVACIKQFPTDQMGAQKKAYRA